MKKKPLLYKWGIWALMLSVLSASFLCLGGQAEARSLWVERGGSERGICADRKACAVGDIVTIVISESTTLSTAKKTDNSKDGSTSLQAGVGIFDFLKAASAGGSDSFSAKGSATATNRAIANVTVTVTDVFPNGNMVLEGTQSIWQNKDEHKITFRGICRMDDILSNNTIPSTKIADATVRFDGKGPLNAKQRQGILTQIFNFLF